MNATVAYKSQQNECSKQEAKFGFEGYPKNNGMSSQRILHLIPLEEEEMHPSDSDHTAFSLGRVGAPFQFRTE